MDNAILDFIDIMWAVCAVAAVILLGRAIGKFLGWVLYEMWSSR